MVKKMFKEIFFLIDVLVSIQPEKVARFSKFMRTFTIGFSKSDTEH